MNQTDRPKSCRVQVRWRFTHSEVNRTKRLDSRVMRYCPSLTSVWSAPGPCPPHRGMVDGCFKRLMRRSHPLISRSGSALRSALPTLELPRLVHCVAFQDLVARTDFDPDGGRASRTYWYPICSLKSMLPMPILRNGFGRPFCRRKLPGNGHSDPIFAAGNRRFARPPARSD